jgi:hypothetical protein
MRDLFKILLLVCLMMLLIVISGCSATPKLPILISAPPVPEVYLSDVELINVTGWTIEDLLEQIIKQREAAEITNLKLKAARAINKSYQQE